MYESINKYEYISQEIILNDVDIIKQDVRYSYYFGQYLSNRYIIKI